MGFFGFLRQKKETEETEETEMPPQELPADQVADVVRDLGKRAVVVEQDYLRHRGAVQTKMEDLRRELHALNRAAFSSEDRMASAVNMAKEAFIKRAHSTLNVQYPDAITYRSLERLDHDLRGMMDYLSAVSPKQLYYLSTYFKAPSTAVIEAIKNLETEVNGLSQFIREEATLLSTLETLKQKTGGLSEKAVIREKLLVMEKKLRKELERTEEKRAAADRDFREFTSSKEWKEIMNISRDADEYREQCEMVRNDFNQAAAACDKAFRKAFHGKKFPLPADLFEEAVLQGKDFSGPLARALDAGLKPAETKKLRELQKMLDDTNLRERYHQLERAAKEAQRVLKMHKGFFGRKADAEQERASLDAQIEGLKAELSHIETQKTAVERIEAEERELVERLMAEAGEKRKIV